ncbi:MAG: ribonuclease D [Pseudomonadota bacterium]
MGLITTTEDLARFCDDAAKHPYVTVDTEFLRERTYFSQLCLIQIGFPGLGVDEIALVDPLADGIDLSPIATLFNDQNTVKVFHAARQDLEIFWHDLNVLPKPFFDTQIAAMVCGFGDQVGYETLVRKVARAEMDKSSRFTDWSQRPLSDKQLTYAANDVTHLRVIYERLNEQIIAANRENWVEEEMSALLDPALYDIDPTNAWTRVRMRNAGGRTLAAAIELAEFRERFAQDRNIPRGRVFKDDALLEVAATRPKTEKELSRARLLTRDARHGDIANGILKAVQKALNLSAADLPEKPPSPQNTPTSEAIADMLRVLLKAVVDRENVAAKLVATASDLDAMARGERDLPMLKGWRRIVFGEDALKLVSGETGLRVRNGKVELVDLID